MITVIVAVIAFFVGGFIGFEYPKSVDSAIKVVEEAEADAKTLLAKVTAHKTASV